METRTGVVEEITTFYKTHFARETADGFMEVPIGIKVVLRTDDGQRIYAGGTAGYLADGTFRHSQGDFPWMIPTTADAREPVVTIARGDQVRITGEFTTKRAQRAPYRAYEEGKRCALLSWAPGNESWRILRTPDAPRARIMEIPITPPVPRPQLPQPEVIQEPAPSPDPVASAAQTPLPITWL